MSQPIVHLRPATLADSPLLTAWDEQPHVKGSDPDTDESWEQALKTNRPGFYYAIAEADGVPFAALLLLNCHLDPTHYWQTTDPGLRAMDIWIGPPQYLNRGLGSQVMRLALAHLFDDPATTAVVIDPLASNAAAHRFYQRHGFVFLEERWFADSHCYVFELTRSNWQRL